MAKPLRVPSSSVDASREEKADGVGGLERRRHIRVLHGIEIEKFFEICLEIRENAAVNISDDRSEKEQRRKLPSGSAT